MAEVEYFINYHDNKGLTEGEKGRLTIVYWFEIWNCAELDQQTPPTCTYVLPENAIM